MDKAWIAFFWLISFLNSYSRGARKHLEPRVEALNPQVEHCNCPKLSCGFSFSFVLGLDTIRSPLASKSTFLFLEWSLFESGCSKYLKQNFEVYGNRRFYDFFHYFVFPSLRSEACVSSKFQFFLLWNLWKIYLSFGVSKTKHLLDLMWRAVFFQCS